MCCYKVKIADSVFLINSMFESTKEFCKEFLTEEKEEFQIEIQASDLYAEQKKSDRERRREGLKEIDYPKEYLETLALYRKMIPYLLKKDTILLHGSGIMVDGEGYLFTAASGVGKSTHTRLWREWFGKRARMINDDKPLLKIKEDGVELYGTPWMGKHGLGHNGHCKLKAICCLKRGETNHIGVVSFQKRYGFLLQQIQRPTTAEGMRTLLKLMERLKSLVELYELECTISKEAVRVAYEGMKGENIETT